MKYTALCKHDLILSNELAFKKGVLYHIGDLSNVIGCNGKAYNLKDFRNIDLYFDLNPIKEEDTLVEIHPSSFSEITRQMNKVYEAKNHDYGNSFDQSLNEFGIIAAITRMSDKFNRIKALAKSKAKVNESLEDTLLDLANYSIMTLLWLKNNKQ